GSANLCALCGLWRQKCTWLRHVTTFPVFALQPSYFIIHPLLVTLWLVCHGCVTVLSHSDLQKPSVKCGLSHCHTLLPPIPPPSLIGGGHPTVFRFFRVFRFFANSWPLRGSRLSVTRHCP